MRDFLILKLYGPIQAWGEHTFEGLRPSANFPTRSGILGLLGACLGIKRNDEIALENLADSIGIAVRVDARQLPRADGTLRRLEVFKMTDYHTIKDAREEYIGLKKHDTIQTWREYLCDAEFTIVLWNHANAAIHLDQIESATKKPLFTPYLGRRSCPLARPLFERRLQAPDILTALKEISPVGGTIYSEEKMGDRMKRVRDVPMIHQPRQFASRNLYVYGGDHVPE